jgi:hypothetical protein
MINTYIRSEDDFLKGRRTNHGTLFSRSNAED